MFCVEYGRTLVRSTQDQIHILHSPGPFLNDPADALNANHNTRLQTKEEYEIFQAYHEERIIDHWTLGAG